MAFTYIGNSKKIPEIYRLWPLFDPTGKGMPVMFCMNLASNLGTKLYADGTTRP